MATKKTQKRPVGRPKKTLDVLPDGWQDIMMTMAQNGASQCEIQNTLDIDDNLWYKFIEREPTFREAFARAKRACKAWWEAQGRQNMKDRDFNNALWAFNMKNRFREDWGDKQDINLNADVVTTKKTVDISKLDTETLKKLRDAGSE